MKRWSEKEINDLKNLNNKTLNKSEIKKIFVDRSILSIMKKSRKMGISISIKYERYNKWSESEYNILKNNFKKDKEDLLNLLPNRSWSAILDQMCINNIQRRNKRWKKEEIDYLKKNYENSDMNIILKNIDRTWTSIKLKTKK